MYRLLRRDKKIGRTNEITLRRDSTEVENLDLYIYKDDDPNSDSGLYGLN